MKKLFALLSIFIVMISCFGCSKQAEMPRAIIGLGLFAKPDGSIVQELEFSAQTKRLFSQGQEALVIMESRKELTRNVNKIREEFYISFLIRYSQAPYQEFKFGKGINITKTVYNETYDTISFCIIFANQASFNFYHPSSNETNNDSNIKTLNPYLIKSISVGQFPFSATITIDGQEITLGQRYLNIYNASFSKYFGDYYKTFLEPVAFVYDYGASYSRTKSDADFTVSNDGMYHHVWVKNADQLENAKIKISIAIPNKGLWQLTFLCVVFAGTLTLLMFFVLKHRKASLSESNLKKDSESKLILKSPKNESPCKNRCGRMPCKQKNTNKHKNKKNM